MFPDEDPFVHRPKFELTVNVPQVLIVFPPSLPEQVRYRRVPAVLRDLRCPYCTESFTEFDVVVPCFSTMSGVPLTPLGTVIAT